MLDIALRCRARVSDTNREAAGTARLTYERMGLARGRPFIVPVTRLIKDCDNWHRGNIANPHDGHVVSMAVMRRDLVW